MSKKYRDSLIWAPFLSIFTSSNGYDRMIVKGDRITASVCPNDPVAASTGVDFDVGVFRFNKFVEPILDGSNYDAEDISDHFPVFAKFY